jgi:hypothetical protein
MALLTPKPRDLQIVRNPGDHLISNRIVLDDNGGVFAIDLAFQMVPNFWSCTITRATGETIVSGVALRDRTDVLMGVSTPGRPRGALFPYDPRRVDPGLDAFLLGTAKLYYAPGGLPLGFFALFETAVM